MPYTDHEVLQTHCKYCYKMFTADSYDELIQKVKEHEEECPKKKS